MENIESRLEQNLREYVLSKGHNLNHAIFNITSWENNIPFNENNYYVPIGDNQFCIVPAKIAEKGTNLGALTIAINNANGNK